MTLLLVGAVVTGTWWTGAALALWRKRAMVGAGFFLGGLAAIAFTFTSADVGIPGWVVSVAAVMRVPVALLLVGGFVMNQPRGSRPDRWSP